MRFPLRQLGIALIAAGWSLPAIAATTFTTSPWPTTGDIALPSDEPNSAEIERSDLVAQERMADAADRMSSLTEAQVWIAALGSGLVAASLYFSAQATRAGYRAARAAENALAAQERPQMMVDKISLGDIQNGTNPLDPNEISVTLTHRNHGKGVGWITEHGFSVAVLTEAELPREFIYPVQKMKWPIHQDAWWGYEPQHGKKIRISAEQRAAIASRNLFAVLQGTLIYEALSGSEFALRYAYIYRSSDATMVPMLHSAWHAR